MPHRLRKPDDENDGGRNFDGIEIDFVEYVAGLDLGV
jgi:hypothetical protein